MKETDKIKIAELKGKVEKGKISIDEFEEKAGNYLGVRIPKLPGLNESHIIKSEYCDTKSLGITEYFERVEYLLHILQGFYGNHVNENYAKANSLSGRLTV